MAIESCNGPDDDGSELHAWLCDDCIRGRHDRCAMSECECDADEHQEPIQVASGRIPITLTRSGRIIGKASLFDCGDKFLWPILEIAFANERIRTITRSNDEWRIDLEPAD